MTKKIAWEQHRDNISKVEYKLRQGSLINGQTVTRDVLGRVISLEQARAGSDTRTHTYGYNTRGELTADTISTGATAAPRTNTWSYDPIGNRDVMINTWTDRATTYIANNLNQYTNEQEEGWGDFAFTYDEEGNQTHIRTNTGEWDVSYNADNRPITFTQDSRRIENKYDYQGRRIEKATYNNNQLQKRLRYIYNGYLQIAAIDATNTAAPVLLHTLYWDPTEPEATRPLLMVRPEDGDRNWYEYTHTLNKNVSHLIDKTGSIVAHYDYDAYGNMIEQTGSHAGRNPIRFSSEYDDEELGLVYYNYRHYNPKDGRWINRDPISESGGINLYGFVINRRSLYFDILGLIKLKTTETPKELLEKIVEVGHILNDLTRKNGGNKEFCVRICKKCNGEYYHANISGGVSQTCNDIIANGCQKGDKDAAVVHSHPSSGSLDISKEDRRRAEQGWPPKNSKGSEYKLDKNLPIATVHSPWESPDKPSVLIYQPNEHRSGSNVIKGKTYRHDGNFSKEGKYSMKDGRRFDFKTANFI